MDELIVPSNTLLFHGTGKLSEVKWDRPFWVTPKITLARMYAINNWRSLNNCSFPTLIRREMGIYIIVFLTIKPLVLRQWTHLEIERWSQSKTIHDLRKYRWKYQKSYSEAGYYDDALRFCDIYSYDGWVISDEADFLLCSPETSLEFQFTGNVYTTPFEEDINNILLKI